MVCHILVFLFSFPHIFFSCCTNKYNESSDCDGRGRGGDDGNVDDGDDH